MKKADLLSNQWGERIGLATLFTVIGSLIMLVFSPWRPTLNRVDDYLGRFALVILLLVATVLLRRSRRLEKYWLILSGLQIMAVAVSLDWIFGVYLVEYVRVNGNTPSGFALLKLNEFAVVISAVLLGTWIFRGGMGSIYFQKGKLKLGLAIGLAAFSLAVIGSIPMASLFYGQDLTLERIAPWIPWILIAVLANAAMEETLFRGLFLRKLEPFFGKFGSNFLIAFVFTALHGTVNYTSEMYLFLAVLFLLALAWGYIMQKTEGIWGSILFHAGMDIPIFLGIFSNFS